MKFANAVMAAAKTFVGAVEHAVEVTVEFVKTIPGQAATIGTGVLIEASNALADTGSTMDVSSATTYLSGTVGPAMASVGGGIVGLAGIALGWRWVKATFF